MSTRLFAGAFALFSIVFLVVMVPGLEANSLGSSQVQAVGLGPAAVPIFAGVATLVLSVIMFLQAPGNPLPAIGARGWINIAYFVAIMLVYLLLMPRIGFLVSSILFLAACFLFYGAASWKTSVLVAVLLPLGTDMLLRKLFLIPLPTFPGF